MTDYSYSERVASERAAEPQPRPCPGAPRCGHFDCAEEEYSDSQRLDEMNTAEDYNRFEEHQLDLDRDAGEFDWGYDDGGEG